MLRLLTAGTVYSSALTRLLRGSQNGVDRFCQIIVHFAVQNRVPDVVAEIEWSYLIILVRS